MCVCGLPCAYMEGQWCTGGIVRGRAPNRGGINEDNMSHIFGSGAGTGNEALLVWVTAAHVLVCHCPVSLCIKLADIDTCSP